MSTIGLIYGSDTGMTEEVVSSIVDNWPVTDLEVVEVYNVKKN